MKSRLNDQVILIQNTQIASSTNVSAQHLDDSRTFSICSLRLPRVLQAVEAATCSIHCSGAGLQACRLAVQHPRYGSQAPAANLAVILSSVAVGFTPHYRSCTVFRLERFRLRWSATWWIHCEFNSSSVSFEATIMSVKLVLSKKIYNSSWFLKDI